MHRMQSGGWPYPIDQKTFMTYNHFTGLVSALSFYNCDNTPKGQEDILYHPLPHHVEDLNCAMCGHFHRGGQLCGSMRKDTAH